MQQSLEKVSTNCQAGSLWSEGGCRLLPKLLLHHQATHCTLEPTTTLTTLTQFTYLVRSKDFGELAS